MWVVYVILAVLFVVLSVHQSRVPEKSVISPMIYRILYALTASFVVAAACYPLFDQLQRVFAPFAVLRWVYRAAWMLLMGMCVFLRLYPYLPGTRKADGTEPCVIVLGAPVLDGQPTQNLLSRADKAAAYALKHPDVDIILSGGKPNPRTEAREMLDRMLEKDAPVARVHLEEQSTNTETNFVFSKALLTELGYSPSGPLAVMTNDFHCLRMHCYARAQGLTDVRHLPAPTPIRAAPVWLFSETILVIQYTLLGHN